MSFVRWLLLVVVLPIVFMGIGYALRGYEERHRWHRPTEPGAIEALREIPPNPFNDGIDRSYQVWRWRTDGRGAWLYDKSDTASVSVEQEGNILHIRLKDDK